MERKYKTRTTQKELVISTKENIPQCWIALTFLLFLLIISFLLKNTIYNKVIFFYITQCFILFKITFLCIPKFICFLNTKGFYGIDLNKINKDKVAEPIGIVPAILYFLFILFYQVLYYNDHKILLEYNAGMLSIIFMTFLGFIDDIFELQWRYKVILPFFACLPLVLSYSGETQVVIPPLLRFFFEKPLINIGIFYYVYIVLLSVFCTNAINIYAGVNGLEVGQTIIIAFFICLHNVIEILRNTGLNNLENERIIKQHFLSLIFCIPFISVNIATFAFNFYPSKGFVGNTFTCFCGIILAVVSIFGHFSKTLVLFLFPQLFNFFISLPQLFHWIPCPRHRIPRINQKNNKLEYSNNLTLINFILYLFGSISEYNLVNLLIALQFITCSIGLFLRYFVEVV